MDGWIRVSRERPCPICGKHDNCEVSDDGTTVWCGRVEEGSIKQNAGGQFLHRLKGDEKPRGKSRSKVAKPKPPLKSNVGWEALAKVWFAASNAVSQREELAKKLGVSPHALRTLCVGFDGSAWTFPERDGTGKIIGINRRLHDGRKLRMTGSNSGLTFARGWNRGKGPVVLPEGASDVAALLTLGLNAVGRPSNTAGAELLVELLRAIPNERGIIVLGENDRKSASELSEKTRAKHRVDCIGCSLCWPGYFGATSIAKKLSIALERPIQWAFPPNGAKDVREWLKTATDSYRQSTLSNSIAPIADKPVELQCSSADALGLPEFRATLCRQFLQSLRIDSINIELPPVEQPTGPEVPLADWRESLHAARIESVGKPGIYLDRSGTGYGKTYADFAAIETVVAKDGRALVVLPTHENCDELESELTKCGIDARAYPGRLTKGADQNCWNTDADVAQAMGLSASAAICPYCPCLQDCESYGYLFELKLASGCTVAIVTHNRAIYTSLETLSTDREFVSIHEDSLSVLRPDCTVKETDLQTAHDEVLTRLVNEPRWLNWYREIVNRDDDGKLVGKSVQKNRRAALREFAILLIEVSEWLLSELATPGQTRRLNVPKTMPKAVGVERLLFRATDEARKVGHRFSGSVWRLLLAVASGEIGNLGVIVDEPASMLTEEVEANHGNPDELAKQQLDRLAL